MTVLDHLDRLIGMVAEVWDVDADAIVARGGSTRTVTEARRVVIYLATRLLPGMPLPNVCYRVARHPSSGIDAFVTIDRLRGTSPDIAASLAGIEAAWTGTEPAAKGPPVAQIDRLVGMVADAWEVDSYEIATLCLSSPTVRQARRAVVYLAHAMRVGVSLETVCTQVGLHPRSGFHVVRAMIELRATRPDVDALLAGIEAAWAASDAADRAHVTTGEVEA